MLYLPLLLVGFSHQKVRAALHIVGKFIHSMGHLLHIAEYTAYLIHHHIDGITDRLQLLMRRTHMHAQISTLYLFQVLAQVGYSFFQSTMLSLAFLEDTRIINGHSSFARKEFYYFNAFQCRHFAVLWII